MAKIGNAAHRIVTSNIGFDRAENESTQVLTRFDKFCYHDDLPNFADPAWVRPVPAAGSGDGRDSLARKEPRRPVTGELPSMFE